MLHCAVEHLCSCTQAFGWSRETEIQWQLLYCNLDGGPDCFWKPPCSLGAADVPEIHCEQYCIQTLLGKRCVIGTHWIVSASDSINGQHHKTIYKKRQDWGCSSLVAGRWPPGSFWFNSTAQCEDWVWLTGLVSPELLSSTSRLESFVLFEMPCCMLSRIFQCPKYLLSLELVFPTSHRSFTTSCLSTHLLVYLVCPVLWALHQSNSIGYSFFWLNMTLGDVPVLLIFIAV